MVTCCAALGCKNTACNRSLSFHKFPDESRNPILYRKWLIAVRRINWKPSIHSKLCSDHFLASDYFNQPLHGPIKVRLRDTAVPSLFGSATRPNKSTRKQRTNGAKPVYAYNKIAESESSESPKTDTQNESMTESTEVISQIRLMDIVCEPNPSLPDSPINDQIDSNSPTQEDQRATTSIAPLATNATRTLTCTWVPPPIGRPPKKFTKEEIAAMQRKIKSREKTIESLRGIIKDLEDKDDLDILEKYSSGMLFEILKNELYNAKLGNKSKFYMEEVKQFATTLFFMSRKAYSFLRQSGFPLPHPGCLRRSMQVGMVDPAIGQFEEENDQELFKNAEDVPEIAQDLHNNAQELAKN